eukprot:scaffold51495_cov38-Cyclotella_meneghiniana.AAC.5
MDKAHLYCFGDDDNVCQRTVKVINQLTVSPTKGSTAVYWSLEGCIVAVGNSACPIAYRLLGLSPL